MWPLDAQAPIGRIKHGEGSTDLKDWMVRRDVKGHSHNSRDDQEAGDEYPECPVSDGHA
jgi:hypothetical protein